VRFDLLTFIAFDLFPPLSLERRVADPLTVCAVLPVGFDTYSLAFLHFFFFPILFLPGWYTSFREGRIINFAFYHVCKNQEAGAIMSFHFLHFSSFGENRHGGKERLTLLLSYREKKTSECVSLQHEILYTCSFRA